MLKISALSTPNDIRLFVSRTFPLDFYNTSLSQYDPTAIINFYHTIMRFLTRHYADLSGPNFVIYQSIVYEALQTLKSAKDVLLFEQKSIAYSCKAIPEEVFEDYQTYCSILDFHASHPNYTMRNEVSNFVTCFGYYIGKNGTGWGETLGIERSVKTCLTAITPLHKLILNTFINATSGTKALIVVI